MIVGLSGYARSGKDESAKALQEIGWERRAFADKLREFLLALNPLVAPGVQPAFGAHKVIATAQEVIDQYGWDGYKESPYGAHMREYLQRLGTECGRELISDTIWIDAALGGASHGGPAPKIVVTDVRFPNEFDAIINRGGMMIRVTRPGVGPANAHPSETALDGYLEAGYFDAEILNTQDVTSLHHSIRSAVLDFM